MLMLRPPSWTALLALASAIAACHAPPKQPPADSTGQVRVALSAAENGITYALRNARFVITASSGGGVTTLDSETDPTATVLTATLATGVYEVLLQDGWALVRTDTGQVVDATLTSPNPRSAQILPGSTTNLTYKFLTSGGVVTIGTGTLEIGIQVTVAGDGGAGDGGTPGCVLSPDSCGAGSVCQLFEGDNGPIGMCVLTCDPVTQQRSDGAPACGSEDPANPTMGCYGVDGRFSCARSAGVNKKHGAPAASATGIVYLNACAPGYQPIFSASATDTTTICIAYCRPTPSYAGNAGNAGGVPPYSCADRGAPAGTECRYLSGFVGTTTALASSVGVCFAYANYTYDHDFDASTPQVPFQSCATFNLTTDVNHDGTPDYLEVGCGPLP